MRATMSPLEAAVTTAVASVDDPEYPGISIADLGLVESLTVGPGGSVDVGLIPTFSGCPALGMIADDVRVAVAAVPGVGSVVVSWLRSPAWSPERITPTARDRLAAEFTVAVRVGSEPARCPLCDEPTRELSIFGPSRCRAVHRCASCVETVEVMRG